MTDDETRLLAEIGVLHDALMESMKGKALTDGTGGKVEEGEQKEVTDGEWWEQLTLPFGGNWNG